MIDEESIPDSYHISWELACYGKAVIQSFPDEFDFLEESHISYLMTPHEIKLKSSTKTAIALIPNAKGQEGNIFWWSLTNQVGQTPDALIVVNNYDWDIMDKKQRVVLVFHELSHLKQKVTPKELPCFSEDTGRPVLVIRDHPVEEFYTVAEKFGAWHQGLERFIELIQQKEGKFPDLDKVVELAERLIKGGA